MKTVDQVEAAREALEFEVDAFLRAKGWHYTSSTPGCFWLWEKVIGGRAYLVSKSGALGIQAALDHDAPAEAAEKRGAK
jgi:hypothetical protein